MNEMGHVAFYISSLNKGGNERVFINLALYLYERGYTITFVTTYLGMEEYYIPHASWKEISADEVSEQDRNVKQVLRQDERMVFVTKNDALQEGEVAIGRYFTGFSSVDKDHGTSSTTAKRARVLRLIWDKILPDVIITSNSKNNIMALMSTVDSRYKVVVRSVGEPSLEYSTRQTVLAMSTAFRRASGIILQTKKQEYFYPPAIRNKCVVLKNTIGQEFFREPYEGEREKVIVSVGTLTRNKNHHMLIKAFGRLKPTHPEWRLVIFGEGIELKHLKTQVMGLGLRDSVYFPGNLDNIADRIYKAGAYVLSSEKEGIPSSLIEAMALGLPCVVTDCPCGGVVELVKDGVNGLVTPVNDAVRLEKTLLRVMDNPGFARSLGKAASDDIKRLYDYETINAEWEKYIRGIIDSAKRVEHDGIAATIEAMDSQSSSKDF